MQQPSRPTATLQPSPGELVPPQKTVSALRDSSMTDWMHAKVVGRPAVSACQARRGRRLVFIRLGGGVRVS